MTDRLAPGDPAPAFSLTDDHGDTVTLTGLAGRRVVLYAYPAAMTPGCTTQACDFRDSLDSLHAAGITVLGLSPDQPEKLARFRERDGLTFPLLSDPDRSVLTAYGAYGEKVMYGKKVQGVIRSTFIIREGAIQKAWRSVKVDGHEEQVLAELRGASSEKKTPATKASAAKAPAKKAAAPGKAPAKKAASAKKAAAPAKAPAKQASTKKGGARAK